MPGRQSSVAISLNDSLCRIFALGWFARNPAIDRLYSAIAGRLSVESSESCERKPPQLSRASGCRICPRRYWARITHGRFDGLDEQRQRRSLCLSCIAQNENRSVGLQKRFGLRK